MSSHSANSSKHPCPTGQLLLTAVGVLFPPPSPNASEKLQIYELGYNMNVTNEYQGGVVVVPHVSKSERLRVIRCGFEAIPSINKHLYCFV